MSLRDQFINSNKHLLVIGALFIFPLAVAITKQVNSSQSRQPTSVKPKAKLHHHIHSSKPSSVYQSMKRNAFADTNISKNKFTWINDSEFKLSLNIKVTAKMDTETIHLYLKESASYKIQSGQAKMSIPALRSGESKDINFEIHGHIANPQNMYLEIYSLIQNTKLGLSHVIDFETEINAKLNVDEEKEQDLQKASFKKYDPAKDLKNIIF